ncbi:unnamed protein product [Nippostrongylus brasiliensis]|uniref:BBS1 domain-containing protein n=1 Tax=Nippostrongylus brasiliensis TaxID=27835 RepID=A0A158QYB8_NIPBR|nr:unnamed protein product [Nippostrongylus brasiliensis]
MRLKVFKGVSMVAESALADMPSAVVSFYNEKIALPAIGVASGSYIRVYKNLKPFYQATITCLASIPKSTMDNIDVLVFGTERGMVRAVDSQAFQIIADCRIAGVPVQIVTHGKLCVATTNNQLMFFSFAGKCLNSISIGEPIRGLELFSYAPKQFEGVLVLLETQVRLYTHNHLLDIIRLERPLSWIKFGQYGREEGALIIGTKEGGLLIKLFRRKASLEERIDLVAAPKAYNIKLNIPKKSKIFIDQTVRERDNFNQISQTYQRDLFLIKHHTTTAFAALTSTAATSVSTDPNHSVDIAVSVNGFGPKFRLTVKLSCATKVPLYNLWLSMMFSPNIYRFDQTLIPVSILMPGHFYTFTTLIECLEPEKGLSEDIRVLLIKQDKPTPIVTAIVTMPVSEMNLLD